ncbi:MAG: putative RND superfamily exporter protein [Myxococcota bacterium]|jgi:predicted RND superfamily exporter protein
MSESAKNLGNHEPPSAFFEAWARLVIRHRFAVLAAVLLLTGLAGYQVVSKLHVDNSIEAFAASGSEAADVLEEFRDEFGRDDMYLILIKGDVFSLPYLKKIQKLDNELSAINLTLESLGERKADRDAKRHGKPVEPKKATPKPVTPADDSGDDDDWGDESDDISDDFGDEDEGWGDEAGGSIVDEVISIVSVRKTAGKAGGITVGDLMNPFPETQADLDRLRDEVLGNSAKGIPPSRTLIGQVIDDKGTWSAILVRTDFMGEADSNTVYEHIATTLKEYEEPGEFESLIAGTPALGAELNRLMLGDLQRMFFFSFGMLILVLFAMFRHPLGAVSPIVVVVMSGIWALGLAATVGIPMTMLTNVLPAFIVCVGVADSVHLLSVYRDGRRHGVANEQAIIDAVASTGKPIFYTTITTAMGLLSFTTASMDAIGQMGMLGGVAVFAAFLNTLLIIPIALSFNQKSLLGVSTFERTKHDVIDRALNFLVGLSAGAPSRRHRTLVVALILGAVAGYGVSKMYVWHNPLSWVPPEQGIVKAVAAADDHLGGTANVQLLIDAKGERGIKDERLILGIDKLDAHIRAYVDPKTGKKIVGNVLSIVDIVRESNQALLGGAPEHYKVPEGQRAIGDRLFAFENAGPDQLGRIMTLDGSRTQMTVRMDWLEATSYFPMTEHIEAGVKEFIPSDLATVRPTGTVYLLLTTVGAMVLDLIRSFGLAFGVIALLMMFLLRSAKLGAIAMVPNLLPIMMILGLMGYADIPIDMANLLIASIALGIAVDDTIHFLHQFKVAYDRTGLVEESIAHTVNHSGRALVITSLVLTGGFLVYLAATMYSLQRFGSLIAGAVVMALVIDLTLTPALIRMTFKDKPTPNPRTDNKTPHAAVS